MKNTTTLKAVLAALTIASMSSLAFAKGQFPEDLGPNELAFMNKNPHPVSIFAEQSKSGKRVKKGIIEAPYGNVHTREGIHYRSSAFSFDPTDTIIVSGKNFECKINYPGWNTSGQRDPNEPNIIYIESNGCYLDSAPYIKRYGNSNDLLVKSF